MYADVSCMYNKAGQLLQVLAIRAVCLPPLNKSALYDALTNTTIRMVLALQSLNNTFVLFILLVNRWK